MAEKIDRKRYKTGNDVVDYVSELAELEKKYYHDDGLAGITALTVPTYISSNRAIMLASHLKQFKTLKNKETPRLRTNFEDVVGKGSSYIKIAKEDMEVVGKIEKFEFAPGAIYFLFLYSEKEGKYYLEVKRPGVEQTERFGFHIDNTYMDKLKVGDRVKKGDTLWKSNSYDEDDLYGFGVNARCVWLIDNWTIEDSIKLRKGFTEKFTSYEEETVRVSLNDNEYFRNLYGDDESYCGFPEIGDRIKDNILAATSKRINSQILYDMKKSNLKSISSLDDRIYYARSNHNGRVVDIDIYCNKEPEDIPETDQNAQLIKYLVNNRRFYQEVYDMCKKIIESGEEYHDDIGFWFKRAYAILNPNIGIRDNNNAFSNMVIDFKVEREDGVYIGNKFTGRYGNKGVISCIVDDEDMPFDENGRPVDIVFNALGIINRLITMPLFEVAFNSNADQIAALILAQESREERERLLFKFMSFFNDRGMYDKLVVYYNGLTDEEKDDFYEDIRKYGIFISIPPLWEDEPLYDRLRRMYREIPELKPKQEMYIRKFGRVFKMMRQLVVGEQYIIKLKQSSKKGFSARSMGFVNMRGLPDKTERMKNNLQAYSTTPIKNGIDDTTNMSIGVDPNEIAKMHLFYRNSIIGRREMSKLLTDDPLNFEDFELKSTYTNRNVEILDAYLMCCGKGLSFPGDTIYLSEKTDGIESFIYDQTSYLVTRETMRRIILDKYFRPKFDELALVGTPEWKDKMYEKYLQHQLKKRDQSIAYLYIKDDEAILD